MTQKDQRDLDLKLRAFEKECSLEEWRDPAYLKLKVTELEKKDIALAYRLMQRVRVIEPTESNLAELKRLQAEAFEENPNLIKTSSSESGAFFNDEKPKAIVKKSFKKIRSNALARRLLTPFGIIVILPVLLFVFYQTFIASPRYESRAQIIVKEPDGMSTLDPSMALMAGFGLPPLNTDIELVKAYINSNDMLNFLQEKLRYTEHFSDKSYDYFSRLETDPTTDAALKFYTSHVNVEIEEKSLVLTVSAQAFTSEFAELLTSTIVKRAEWYINEIGHNLARAQLKFVEKEHDIVQQKLKSAKSELIKFQQKYNLLDPQAEGLALQQITYGLEAEIARARTELETLRSSMSDDAPAVVTLKNKLESLMNRLNEERNRLTETGNSISKNSTSNSVGEIIAKFSDYKIDVELALQAYTASQVSLEKSRIEAYRQLKFLVVVESPTFPELASYPETIYNVSLLFVLLLMLFGIGKIIIATVDELRQ